MLPAMMLPLPEMGAWLLARPLSSVAVLGPVDGDAVRAALDAAAPPEDGRQGLVFGEVPPVPADALAEAAAAALASALERGPELAGHFCFNQPVATPRGSRPRVDLLCQDARLVIEIDGYADHTTRDAFRRDRHRDYELLLSGYAAPRARGSRWSISRA